jgi:ABC-type branched-subunit amino acid transport system substrate-binding protein
MNKRISIVFCILGIMDVAYAKTIFPTLSATKKYAYSLSEYVDTENNNWVDPDFSLFHKSLKPGFGRRILQWFGIGYDIWNQYAFKSLLQNLTKQRELAGLIGNFIQKYEPRNGDYMYIWTDLFGAFHSLVRDLDELKSQGIIDDSLNIIKKNCLFVFNGNVISHSPYSLETISLVMRLMENNPDNVVYIRGNQEKLQEWHSYSFARELKVCAAQVSHEIIPLNTQVTRFFNTLAAALYIPQVTEQTIETVVIANNDIETNFKEENFAGFLEEKSKNQLTQFKLSNKRESKKPIELKAIITSEDRSTAYHQTDGLSMLGTKHGATVWINFSSPTNRNRRLYEFFYDAVVKLSITNGIDQWTLGLINQDVRTLLGFKEVATYNLVTGQQIKSIVPQVVEKVDVDNGKKIPRTPTSVAIPVDQQKQEVIFGSTIDLSKGVSTLGKPLKEGYDLAFDKVAREGGVGAFRPRIIILDDEYTPKKTQEHLEEFKKKNIDIFLGSTGSANLQQVYLPYIQKGEMLVLFPYTGAPSLRKSDLKNIAHYRIGYVDEGRILAEYALDTLKAQKIAIFYQNDPFGKGPLEGAMEVFNKRDFKNFILIPYERNDLRFDQQAERIRQNDPDTIFFFAVTTAARSFIRLLGVQFLKGKNLIGMSVYDESFDRLLAEMGLEFLMVRVVPDPKTSDIEIVREYVAESERMNKTPNLTSLEAYISASILFDLLRRITPPLSKEKLITIIEKTKNYPFKGLILDYNPETHELGRRLWLDTGQGPWIEKIVRQPNENQKRKKDETQRIPISKLDEQELTSAADVGSKQKIMFGSLMDLSKGASPIGKQVKEGLKLRFDKERQDPTLTNVMPMLVTQDDQYTPKITRAEIEKFINDLGISIIIGAQGSASLESYLDLIKQGKILVLFPFTGAPIFRKPDLTHLIHYRGSYIREGEELIKYALENLKAQKIVIFYQNDAFGRGALEGARQALKKAGITDFVEVPHERNTVNFKKQIETIQKANPDTILFSTNAIPIRGLIQQMGVDFFSKKNLLGLSVYEDAFEHFLRDKGLTFILIRMVPDPKESQLEIAKEYRAAADKAHMPYDRVSFEQYINASILFDILKNMEKPITKEKIIDALENIKNYTFKGLKLDFNPETRELSPVLWIDDGSKKWLERSTRKKQ